MKKTTLNIDETVMAQLKAEAIRRRTTMGALVEAGIRRVLAEGAPDPLAGDDLPPLLTVRMGRPLVDVADREALGEVLDQERDARLHAAYLREGAVEEYEAPEPRILYAAEEPAPYDAGGGADGDTGED